jgi:hypothetical protein
MRNALFGRMGRKVPRGAIPDHAEEPQPDAWSEFGGHDQVLRGEAGTGYETPARLKRTAQIWGQDYGAARMAENKSLGEVAAPNRWLTGAVGVRKGTLRQEHIRRMIPFGQRVRMAEARKAEAKEKLHVLGQRLMRLTEQILPPLEERAAELEHVFKAKLKEYMAMPRMLRGYFETHKIVVFVGTAVVVFDCWVLHGVLEYSGMSPVTVWGTSLTVPLAIAAINHAFGVTAGAIGLRAPANQRMKLVAVLFVAGVGAMVIAFVLLTVFRAQAADSQNQAIQALANGDTKAQLTFFISPIWMGPLQIAGSFGAIAVTAFWVMAKHGREFVTMELAPARIEWEKAVAELAQVRQRIEGTHQELETAALVEHQVEADAQAALVEADAGEDILDAAVGAEGALEGALQGEYEATYAYFDQIGKNGGVWRMAMATVFPKFGRPYTPGATDAAADDDLIAARHAQKAPKKRGFFRRTPTPAEAGRNGHRDHHVDPDHLTKL